MLSSVLIYQIKVNGSNYLRELRECTVRYGIGTAHDLRFWVTLSFSVSGVVV
jgi:hypothetical protein